MFATVARAVRAAYRIANRGPMWAPQLSPANITAAGLVLVTLWAVATDNTPNGLYSHLSPMWQDVLAVGAIVGYGILFIGILIFQAITVWRRARRMYRLSMLPGMAKLVLTDKPFRVWLAENALLFDPANANAEWLVFNYQLACEHARQRAQRRRELLRALVPFNLAGWCRT